MEIPIAHAIKFVWFSCIETLLHLSLPPVRVWILRWCGVPIGDGTVILNCTFFNAYHYGFSKLRIGKRCFIGDEVMIDLRGETILDDLVTISNRVTLVTHMNVGYKDHPLQSRYPLKESAVHIKRGSYIGVGAIVLPGVTVGVESVVGAGAVVTKDVSDRTVVVGVPARVMTKRK